MVAANQIGEHAPGPPLRRALDDRRPVGARARAGARRRDVRDRRPRPRAARTRSARTLPVARQPPARAYRWPTAGPRVNGRRRRQAPAHPRRGGARVRAPGLPHLPGLGHRRRGAASPTGSSTTTSGPRTRCSTRCSSSAGTCCSTAIDEIDAPSRSRAREKLYAIASFIVDSYRHDPDLMKVIIVEVTRAANTFGRTHLPKIGEAYGLIADIVAQAQADGDVPRHASRPSSPRWPSTARSSRC